MASQFRIRLFDIEPRQDQGDEKVKDHGHPQIHDVQHVYGGSRLFSRAADVAAESQKPAGQSGPLNYFFARTVIQGFDGW